MKRSLVEDGKLLGVAPKRPGHGLELEEEPPKNLHGNQRKSLYRDKIKNLHGKDLQRHGDHKSQLWW
ncbi:hypothetical protein DVH24_019438 [Malus domestica]|uniref:Uncharacterized protein n=1 Tax=Malus domestica TaxID=3750 RepID=A0A498I0D9_MALDO|nr:hypothetical protein DVH24_019438 [Malus domestica]